MNRLFQNNHHTNKAFTYEECHFALSQYQKETGRIPFFISGWDVASDVLLPHLIVKQTIPSIEQNINKYYLVDGDDGCDTVSKYFRDRLKISIPPSQIMVGSSATSLLCLVLLSLVSGTEKQVLILEPSYFSVHDTLDLIRCNYQTICVSTPQFTYDYDKIKHVIQEEKIGVIVVTDPIFGSGIPINLEGYQQLITLAKHHLTRAYREKKQKKCYQPYTKHRLTGQ